MQNRQHIAVIEHMEWADARTWASVRALGAERVEGSDLRDRLFHIHLVQQLYLAMWRGQPLPAVPQLLDYPDLEAVRRWGRTFYPEARALLARADEGRLARPVVVPFSERLAPPGGSVTHATLAETVIQVGMHTAHHRGQLATRIRELGGEPPLTDFVVWIWTGRPAAEWHAIDVPDAAGRG